MLTLTLISLLCAADARPVDAGVKVADAGVVTADAGVKVADAGAVTADAGLKLADAGVLAAAPTGAPKLTPEVKALVDRVQAFYEKTADFTAGFEQRYAYTASKRTQTSTGQVTFKKPAMMRWEYEKPSKKTFVLAGPKIYAYDPEAKLLTVAAIGTNQLSASVTFLWGQGKLADEFAIVAKPCAPADGGACATQVLEMTPLKPDPRFKRVLLEVDLKTAQVIKSTVIDPDGSQNAISFLQLKTNTGVDAAGFKLNVPQDTQVQDFTGGAKPTPDAGK
jgi:outer membrane lipoprotein carrier protein